MTDSTPMESFEVQLDGEKITINTKEICSIIDVDKDMREVSAQISFYGKLLGAAEKARDRSDAAYRAWKGNQLGAVVKADPKLAEWKAKAAVEAMPKFAQFKAQAAEYTGWITSLYWLCKSLTHKAEILRTLGATMRSEMAATGMTTKREKK